MVWLLCLRIKLPSEIEVEATDIGCSDHNAVNIYLTYYNTSIVRPRCKSSGDFNSKSFCGLSWAIFAYFVSNMSKINWLDVYYVESANNQFNKLFSMFMVVNSELRLKRVMEAKNKTKSSTNKWYSSTLQEHRNNVGRFYFLKITQLWHTI